MNSGFNFSGTNLSSNSISDLSGITHTSLTSPIGPNGNSFTVGNYRMGNTFGSNNYDSTYVGVNHNFGNAGFAQAYIGKNSFGIRGGINF